MGQRIKNALALFLILALSLSACTEAEDVEKKGVEIEKKQLNLLCVGDVMTHAPQINAAESNGIYDFSDVFEDVKGYISEADVAMCNLETTFAGEPYTGYPTFSSPDTLAANLKDAGFDVAFTANNHMLDKGVAGLERTLDVCSEAGIVTSGTHRQDDENYTVIEVKGIGVGLIAYTYETAGGTLNGNPMSEEAKAELNSFAYESDLEELKTAIDAARDDGAEVIITYFHLGEEYQREPNEHQREIARKAVGFGADIIFASHPHVLQSSEYIDGVPVFYSMGNFISNQRSETLNNRYTEQGMLAYVDVEYDGTKVTNVNMSALPTWLDKWDGSYKVVPLDANFETNGALLSSGHIERARQALVDCREMYGEDILKY